MYCSLGDSLLADKPAKQILLGSGETCVSPFLSNLFRLGAFCEAYRSLM